jgi:IMP cyclohydrolase
MDQEDPENYARKLWEALNEDNKVSLFVRAIDLATHAYKDVIVNKYKPVKE